MEKTLNVLETGLNAIGIAIGVSDMENVLNVILLIISIASILFRAGYAIYQKIKEKKYNEIAKELDDAKEALEQLQNKEDTDDGK